MILCCSFLIFFCRNVEEATFCCCMFGRLALHSFTVEAALKNANTTMHLPVTRDYPRQNGKLATANSL